MKIIIDTSKDSKEDIKKAIEFLKSLADKGDFSPEEATSSNFGAMFSEPEKKEERRVELY